MSNRHQSADDQAADTTMPSECPSCHSAKVTTTSKTTRADTAYWRCLACGEVWNVMRRESTRSSRYRPYGQ